MYIQAVIKCDVDNTPYRVYINGELMTERYYADPDGSVSNTLHVHLKHSNDYNVEVVSLSETLVKLESCTITEKNIEMA